MTFLNPVILFGLAAAGIPVLLHFLNLRKLKKVEFSSLKFLKELQQTKIKRLKFKRIFLLILRVLIIVLVVFAFARPTIKSNIPIADSSTEKTVFLLLDNSYSMSYVESNGSLLNQAKSIIKDISDNDEGSNRYYLFTTTGDSVFFKKEDFNKDKMIESITIKSVKGDLTKTLEDIAAVSQQEETLIHELFIFSDLQISNLDTRRLSTVISEFDKFKKVTLLDFTLNNINNRSVSSIELRNQIIRPGSEIVVKALITNHSNSNVENQTASLFINGNRRSLKSFDLEAGQSKDILFNTTLSDSGFIYLYIELEQDEIEYDNNAYLSFFIPSKINVNIFSNDGDDYTFLKTALEESESVNINVFSPNRFNGTTQLKNDVDIVFINESPLNISESLSEGNRLMIFPGKNVNAAAYNSSIQPLGIYTSILQQKGLLNFQNIFFEHPVLKDLFETDKSKLNTPSVTKVLKRPKSGVETPIITLSDDTPVFSEIRTRRGLLLLNALSPTLDWSNLPLKSIFAPLMLKSVFYLSGNVNTEKKYTGSEISVTLNGNKKLLKIINPENEEEYITDDEIGSERNFIYRNTSKAGFYKFFSGEKIFSVGSVNIDPAESVAEHYEINDIKNIFKSKNISASIIFRGENILAKLSEDESGYEIWKHFLFAAIIFALIEMFVARTTKKELITNDEV